MGASGDGVKKKIFIKTDTCWKEKLLFGGYRIIMNKQKISGGSFYGRLVLLKAVSFETIVVAEDFLMDEGRRIYLLFSKDWGGKDLDDNGIGVCCIDEKITEIGYKDIAF